MRFHEKKLSDMKKVCNAAEFYDTVMSIGLAHIGPQRRLKHEVLKKLHK